MQSLLGMFMPCLPTPITYPIHVCPLFLFSDPGPFTPVQCHDGIEPRFETKRIDSNLSDFKVSENKYINYSQFTVSVIGHEGASGIIKNKDES